MEDWRSAGARTSPGRSSRLHRDGRRRIWSARSRATRSCSGCSTRCSGGSWIPCRRFGRYLSGCSNLATELRTPTLAEIEEARLRIEGVARVTPVYGSETFSRLSGREVSLKAENLQRTGAFKVRGAV